MDRYYAKVHGNDVGASAKYDCGNDLAAAKAAADDQLGDGFRHHSIAIYDRQGDQHEAVATRDLSSDEWQDNE
jgi:hypothetical protein